MFHVGKFTIEFGEDTFKGNNNSLKVQKKYFCNGTKSCFREAFKVGILSEEETVKVLEMTDDRNLSTHTYDEEAIEEIYQQVRNYWKLMDDICEQIIESSINH